jgi:hypothetical protein
MPDQVRRPDCNDSVRSAPRGIESRRPEVLTVGGCSTRAGCHGPKNAGSERI